MKTMKKILSLLAVAAMAFTACTTDVTDDVVKNESVEYATPLEFGLALEETKAFMDDETTIQFEEGDFVGVYVTPVDATAEVTKNAKGTIHLVNGSPRVNVDVASFAPGDKVMAYYPYNSLNDTKDSFAMTLQIPEVQAQAVVGKINCKYLPMVSVATNLAAEHGGTILFRPVASIMKLNIYSDNDEHQADKIRRIKFSAQKHEDVTGCNYVAGNCPNFDLTTVTEDSEIAIVSSGIYTSHNKTDAQLPYACYVIADYNEEGPQVGYSSADGECTPVYLILYPGSFGGKYYTETSTTYSSIQIYTETLGRFDVQVTNNYEFGRAVIRPFNINLANATLKGGIGIDYIHKHAVTEGTLKEDGETLASGHVVDQLLNEELVVIGSGTECDNMRGPLQVTWNTVTCSSNTRTFYAQTLDGANGFRFQYYTAGNNTMKRGDKIKLNLGAVQWFKRPVGDGWEYYCTSFSPSNIFKLTPGCEDEIETKEKSISELTVADINTDVKLLDMEFVVKDAPYVTGYSSPAMTDTSDNPVAGNAGAIRGQFATMMQDANNDAIFILINENCAWSRDLTTGIQVPQGVGSVHGVLVNCDYKAYGNLGNFQLRPFDNTSFDMGATKADAVNIHAAWYLNQYTVSVGKYTWNGASAPGGFRTGANNSITTLEQNKMHATVGLTDGSAVLYPTNLTAFAKHNNGTGGTSTAGNFSNWQYHPDVRDSFKGIKQLAATLPNADNGADSKATCLAYRNDVASYYGWNEDGSWDGTTTGLVAEFPGASKEMAISFSIGSMTPGKTNNSNVISDLRSRQHTFGFPLYWKVECSIDGGTTWTRCTCATTGQDQFKMNPTMHYFSGTHNYYTDANKTLTTEGRTTPIEHCPSFLQQKFVLPASAVGAAKVMVKLSPASLRLSGFPETFTDSIDTGVDCTKDYYYSHILAIEDIAVTTVK